MKDLILLDSFIIDFAILSDLQTVKIVEINPFGESTGSALFNWKDDQSIIKGNLCFSRF